MPDEYTNQHYVPQWYQKKFILPGESELFYLDLRPGNFTDPRGIVHQKQSLFKQGTKKCFVEKDLYTTKIQSIESRDIEKYFFGDLDRKGRDAVKYFEEFTYPIKAWGTKLEDIMKYLSTQKLRTPKGLTMLSEKISNQSKNNILRAMLRDANIHCAIWTECVWLIADASKSNTKFIISDHPVTIYNRECGPRSIWCKGANDPEIWLQGSHTIFPLSLNKILILTNLSWVRNPYQPATKLRPNPIPYRNTIFKMTDVQILRYLSEQEVREINFVIKSRSFRYIAAAKEEWLYPEKFVSKSDWNKFGHGYLFMPDPRSIHWGGEIFWGNKDGTGGAMDEYGRRPWDPDYNKERNTGSEYESLTRFKGEFARLFGPYRRGRIFEIAKIEEEKYSDKYHKHLLDSEKRTRKRKKR